MAVTIVPSSSRKPSKSSERSSIHEIFEIGYLIGFHRFLFYLSFWFLLFRFGMAASFYFSLLEYMKSIKIARVFKDGKVKIDFRGKTENPLYNKQLIVLS